jgi:hypothetical protein
MAGYGRMFLALIPQGLPLYTVMINYVIIWLTKGQRGNVVSNTIPTYVYISRKLASASWSLLALASIGGAAKDIT